MFGCIFPNFLVGPLCWNFMHTHKRTAAPCVRANREQLNSFIFWGVPWLLLPKYISFFLSFFRENYN